VDSDPLTRQILNVDMLFVTPINTEEGRTKYCTTSIDESAVQNLTKY
jgi:hypothetical protein